MRSKLDNVETLPTEERVVGEPRCCWSATAGRQTIDGIHFGDAHLVEQTPGIRRDGFQIAPLRFRVKRAECERRFAGAGHAGEYDQGIARDVEIDVLEIVLTRAAHANEAGA